MVRFVSINIFALIASTAIVPLGAAAQGLEPVVRVQTAPGFKARQAPVTVSLAPGVTNVMGIVRRMRTRIRLLAQPDIYAGKLNFGASFGSWDRSDLEAINLSFSRQF